MRSAGLVVFQTRGFSRQYRRSSERRRDLRYDLPRHVLHLLGLDHEKLAYEYSGRNFRLTDVAGVVARKIIA